MQRKDLGLLVLILLVGAYVAYYNNLFLSPVNLANTANLVGLFGIFELVRDRARYEPMAPYNSTSDEMAALGRFFREQGLYTFVRWNTFFANPPLIVTEAQLEENLAAAGTKLDEGLKAELDSLFPPA